MSNPVFYSSVNVQSCNFSQPGQAPGRLTWGSVVLQGSSCAQHRDTQIDTTDRETCDNGRHVIIIGPRQLNAVGADVARFVMYESVGPAGERC